MKADGTLFIFLATLSCIQILWVEAFERCSQDLGGGICPDGSTCCRKFDGKSGCIPSDMGRYNATCCSDHGMTGCPLGYACSDIVGDEGGCQVVNRSSYTDPLVQHLPRYVLCDATGIDHVYGLTISNGSEFAYYSSHGSIDGISSRVFPTNHSQEIQMALILIHGASRNGDDYFCTARACADLQDTYENVLVIAPQFYSENDVRPRKELLYWDSDKDGSWRYGADAIGPVPDISSFSCLDKLIDLLWRNIDTLKEIVIAGHSSGGQTVQRWSLLTTKWRVNKMRAVIANPSSFVYLEPLRLIDSSWKIPNNCQMYDKWEWGLSDGGPLNVPYRDRVIQNASQLISRFQERQIIYLSGSQDRCNVSGPNGWCNSHGLETTCMDEAQGGDRLERSGRYWLSLMRLGFGATNSHVYHVVPGVGHDHAMMFQSPIGIKSLFEGISYRSEDEEIYLKSVPITQNS